MPRLAVSVGISLILMVTVAQGAVANSAPRASAHSRRESTLPAADGVTGAPAVRTTGRSCRGIMAARRRLRALAKSSADRAAQTDCAVSAYITALEHRSTPGATVTGEALHRTWIRPSEDTRSPAASAAPSQTPIVVSSGASSTAAPTASTAVTSAVTAATADTAANATTAAAQTTDCFASPKACGFPDPNSGNVGVSNCSALPAFSPSDLPASSYYYPGSGNTLDIIADNVTIQGYDIGNWLIYGDGVSDLTLDDDCVSYDGHSNDGSTAVWSTGSGLTVENSTVIAPGCTASGTTVCTSGEVDESLIGGGDDTLVSNDILAGAVEPINGLGAGSVVVNNYVVANGSFAGAHSEDIYESNTAGILIFHNTLLNPMDQSAVIYGDTPIVNGQEQPCVNRMAIIYNLMAGGGYTLLSCAQASDPGTSGLLFVANDIGRCDGNSSYDASLGGDYCGSNPPAETTGDAIGSGQDSTGYWPQGGFFGVAEDVYCPPTSEVVWEANRWDDNGASVSCPS